MQSKQIKEKSKKTCLERYGVEWASSIQDIIIQRLLTKEIRYGSTRYVNKEKTSKTCLERYGVNYYFQSDEFKKKSKSTSNKHFGVDNPMFSKEIINRIKDTNLIKYNSESWWNSDNAKEYFINKYGVEVPIQSDIIKQKQIETKRKNHTFNTSSTEDKTYFILKEKYPDIIRQYYSKQYPYACDFYIPSKDLYIECNYHWTHGGHPYNKEQDKDIIEYWKSKRTIYYNNAIKVWTISDVNKRQIAKENNLNYIELWKFDENFIKSI